MGADGGERWEFLFVKWEVYGSRHLHRRRPGWNLVLSLGGVKATQRVLLASTLARYSFQNSQRISVDLFGVLLSLNFTCVLSVLSSYQPISHTNSSTQSHCTLPYKFRALAATNSKEASKAIDPVVLFHLLRIVGLNEVFCHMALVGLPI